MIAADAEAPALVVGAPDAGHPRAPRASDAPFGRGERFKGQYWCSQGRTELTLVIEDVDGEDVEALFEFSFPGSSTSAAAEGSYRMRGTWEARGRTLKLKGEQWIDQPTGYIMVDLSGTVGSSGVISGRVSGAPQCTTFSVTPERAREPVRRP
jgi:hypothetical protein